MNNYRIYPNRQRANLKPNFNQVLQAYETGKAKQQETNRALISIMFLVLFVVVSYIQLSDIQKSLIISNALNIGQTIETLFLNFCNLI